jgi:metal-sulfur cluster biosynthetic enzyme
MATTEQVLKALDGIIDPCSKMTGRPISIVDLGLVDEEGVTIHGDDVEVGLILTDPMCVFYRDLTSCIKEHLQDAGFRNVKVTTRGEIWIPARMKKACGETPS